MLVEHQVSKVSSGMILAKLKGWLAGLGMVLALVAMLSSVTRVDGKSDAEATLIAWSGRVHGFTPGARTSNAKFGTLNGFRSMLTGRPVQVAAGTGVRDRTIGKPLELPYGSVFASSREISRCETSSQRMSLTQAMLSPKLMRPRSASSG